MYSSLSYDMSIATHIESSFIVIVNLPILESQELASILTNNLLPDLLDVVKNSIIKSEVHGWRWESQHLAAGLGG
jgi:hypothetical protein